MPKQIITKRCSSCKNYLPIKEYNKDRSRIDGLNHYCRKCSKEKDHKYRHSSHGINITHLYIKSDAHKTACKRYRQSEKGKTVMRRAFKKYKAKNPLLIQAISKVNNSIKGMKLPKPNTLPCYCCNRQAEQYHHYLGYEPEHWFDVLPVCRKCHRTIHASLRTLSVPAQTH